jgi:hypothetical protein
VIATDTAIFDLLNIVVSPIWWIDRICLLRRRSAKGAFYSGVPPPTVQCERSPRMTAGNRIAESSAHQAPPRSSSGLFGHHEDRPLEEAGDLPPRFELKESRSKPSLMIAPALAVRHRLAVMDHLCREAVG